MAMFSHFIPMAATGMAELINGLDNLVFFGLIFEFILDEIDEFQNKTLDNVYSYMLIISGTLLTLWITIKGYLIATGQSKEPMMGLVVNGMRAMFILGMAGLVAGHGGKDIYGALAKSLPDEISHMVAGSDMSSLERKIDINLVLMQAALGSVDQAVKLADKGGQSAQEQEAKNAKLMMGIGMGGPAITGGALLMLNKIALALFVGFAPFFIMCLLFDYTKALFSKWLYYGIGTVFSLVVLSAMVSIAMKVVLGVVGSIWMRGALGGLGLDMGTMQPLSSVALQQGGIGLILTILIVSAPPMAAMFFQGVLGQFSSYNQMAPQNVPQGVPASGGGAAAQSQAGRNGADGTNATSSIMPTGPAYTGGSGAVANENTLRSSSDSRLGIAVNKGAGGAV